MNSDEAFAELEKLDRLSSNRMSMLSYLPHLLTAPYIMGGRGSSLGLHRGECRKPKNLDTRPDRAKGMKAFDVNGMTIYAGTLKAARKKARLISIHMP